jgi:hypothetical protein
MMIIICQFLNSICLILGQLGRSNIDTQVKETHMKVSGNR